MIPCARFICKRCLTATRSSHPGKVRHVSQSAHWKDDEARGPSKETRGDSKEPGALSRKLQEATEDALLTGGRAGLRAVQEAGFSEELKAQLQSRIASANLGSSIDGHGQSDASWTGEEPTTHAVLRMLDDAHKPLKPELRGRFQPPKHPKPRRSAPQRAATARDEAATYAAQSGLTREERDKLRQQFRERFEPTSRPVAVSISGLAGLANERIEAAMARGQFANLPRGKPAVADPLASNPYVDTTEYLMNRIVRRQEMAPPWIEKQQELTKAARAFRAKLRDDWRRHAARMVAARGGSLEEQVEAAAGFRDEEWEQGERRYLLLAVERLNEVARGYNLMAPEVARKPYFELGRELEACYADVAEGLGGEIRERAVRPATRGRDEGDGEGGDGGWGRVYVRDARPYGFREWWRDVWRRK